MKSPLVYVQAFGKRRDIADGSSDVKASARVRLAKINQALWLALSLFVITGLINVFVGSHRLIVGFYTLPTLFAAYAYGRKYAVLTATASIFMVVLFALTHIDLFVGATFVSGMTSGPS